MIVSSLFANHQTQRRSAPRRLAGGFRNAVAQKFQGFPEVDGGGSWCGARRGPGAGPAVGASVGGAGTRARTRGGAQENRAEAGRRPRRSPVSNECRRVSAAGEPEAPSARQETGRMDLAEDSAIRRKVAGNRVGRAPIPGIEEIGENFATLLDERLRGLMRTLTSTIVIDCEVKKLSSVLEEIPVPAMIAVVDVRGSQNSALMNIGMDLLFNVVDLRMGGDPAAAPGAITRSVTSIDCALCEDFIRVVLEAFEAALRVHLGPGIRSAMKLDHFEQHVTMVRIAPDHSDVLVLKLSLDMGEAARSGEFDFVLPLAVLDSYRAAAPGTSQSGGGRVRSDIWSRHMAKAANDAPVRLRAVLHRQKLNVAQLQALEVGDLLPLPQEAREAAELVIEGPSGGSFAVGRIGAMDGGKAVKLTEPPDRTLLAGLKRMLAAKDAKEKDATKDAKG
ncbi:MAG: hypothetical protein CML43_15470 [Rhodobacteraceae bacterium]|nr:hypothetical protein [Paracoccaceae bacterium]